MSNELNLEALQEISGGMAPIVIDWKEFSGKRFTKGLRQIVVWQGPQKVAQKGEEIFRCSLHHRSRDVIKFR